MARRREESQGVSFKDAVDLTQQQFREECDVNRIVSRYRDTGMLPLPGPRAPVARYGDFSNAPDFMEAQNIVLRARQQFDALPVKVRDRFNHDPLKFLEFVHDRKNLREANELGLLSEEAAKKLADEAAAAAAAAPKSGEGK